jgi:hypothetical protein
MFTNKELAQFCINNNTIEMINNLNWNVNEMCISYFIGSKPLWWDNNYWRYVSCGTSHNKGNKDKAGVSRSGGAAKVRSKTFVGIANAIAEQFSEYLTT